MCRATVQRVGSTKFLQLMRVWRGRQSSSELDRRQRQVLWGEVVDMEVRVLGCLERGAHCAGWPVCGRREGEGWGLDWRLLFVDSWRCPGVEEMRVRNRLCLGRLEICFWKSGRLWGGGGTWEMPVRRSSTRATLASTTCSRRTSRSSERIGTACQRSKNERNNV